MGWPRKERFRRGLEAAYYTLQPYGGAGVVVPMSVVIEVIQLKTPQALEKFRQDARIPWIVDSRTGESGWSGEYLFDFTARRIAELQEDGKFID